jgi:hypothetical protein
VKLRGKKEGWGDGEMGRRRDEETERQLIKIRLNLEP